MHYPSRYQPPPPTKPKLKEGGGAGGDGEGADSSDDDDDFWASQPAPAAPTELDGRESRPESSSGRRSTADKAKAEKAAKGNDNVSISASEFVLVDGDGGFRRSALMSPQTFNFAENNLIAPHVRDTYRP